MCVCAPVERRDTGLRNARVCVLVERERERERERKEMFDVSRVQENERGRQEERKKSQM